MSSYHKPFAMCSRDLCFCVILCSQCTCKTFCIPIPDSEQLVNCRLCHACHDANTVRQLQNHHTCEIINMYATRKIYQMFHFAKKNFANKKDMCSRCKVGRIVLYIKSSFAIDIISFYVSHIDK